MNSQDTKRYPIGRFEYGKSYSNEDTKKNIRIIARLPKELKKVLKKLKGGQLDAPYRKGGWTARQVVHHLADSHMNAYIRMKMAVTEQAPIIKPYEEAEWAETEDGKNASVKVSLKILAPLHRRWIAFLESLSDEALDRGYYHPGLKRLVSLPEAIALYAWHSRHHLAHIRLVTKARDEEEHDEAVQEKPIATTEKPRRGRRPAAAKTDAEPAQRRKPGRKPKASAATAATGAAPKRTRRTKAEMEAARTQNAAASVSVERKKPGRKPKSASAKPAAAEPAKRRGMSPEHMAKIRAARQAKLAAAKPAAATTKKSAATGAAPKRTRRTKAEMEAARTQNAA
ncbi:MAG: putative metal-dependent hydrolase, partial [Saprospiraceae bacterium]|nr:putative metal-dependent hydrolase [Saprospiraceae bacterium]